MNTICINSIYYTLLTVVDIKKKVLNLGRAEYKSMIQQITDESNTCFAQKCSSVICCIIYTVSGQNATGKNATGKNATM